MRVAAGRPASLMWVLADDGGSVLTPADDTNVTVSIYTGLTPAVISGVTLGSPALVATAAPHGLSVGMQVQIAGVIGTTEINGTWTIASVPTPSTFTIPVAATNPFAGPGTVTEALYLDQVASFVTEDQAWEWTLPAQTQLDSLVAMWSATVGSVTYTEALEVDVVGGRLADPWLMRQTDPDVQNVMSSPLGKQALLLLLDQIEEGIRDILGYPPVLEGYRVTWDTLRGTLNDALYVSGTVNGLPYGWGAGKMMIPGIKFPAAAPGGTSPVYAMTINGTAQDPVADIPRLLAQNGCLIWSDYRPWISGRYAVWGTHGGGSNPGGATDGELRWAARKLVHHYALTSDIPDRAFSIVTEGAQIFISQPSSDKPTGIPEVDAVLVRKRAARVI